MDCLDLSIRSLNGRRNRDRPLHGFFHVYHDRCAAGEDFCFEDVAALVS